MEQPPRSTRRLPRARFMVVGSLLVLAAVTWSLGGLERATLPEGEAVSGTIQTGHYSVRNVRLVDVRRPTSAERKYLADENSRRRSWRS